MATSESVNVGQTNHPSRLLCVPLERSQEALLLRSCIRAGGTSFPFLRVCFQNHKGHSESSCGGVRSGGWVRMSPAPLQGGLHVPSTYLEQMISSDDCTPGSSPRWLLERFSFRRLMSPQGMTEGREDRQLSERSSSVIWQEMSMSQSRSTQGNLRWDHFTRSAWIWRKEKSTLGW